MEQPENLSSIIERIQKLLALTESTNEHEAAVAAAKAQELLAKYELDMSVVENHAIPDMPEIIEDNTPWSYSKGSRTKWEIDLAHSIAVHNRCKILVGHRLISWIGNRKTLKAVEYIHAQLAARLQILANEATRAHIAKMKALYENEGWPVEVHGPFHHTKIAQAFGSQHGTIAFRNSWLQGAVSGVAHQLFMADQQWQQANADSKALVVVSQQALAAFMEENYPRLGHVRMKRSNGAGWDAGYKTGSTISIHAGLGGHSQKHLKGS